MIDVIIFLDLKWILPYHNIHKNVDWWCPMKRKKINIFLIEPRSVTDPFWLYSKTCYFDDLKDFSEKIEKIRLLTDADETIVTTVSPVSSSGEGETIDFGFKELKLAMSELVIVEGYGRENKLFLHEHCHLTKWFYGDGSAHIDRTAGFGNYRMVCSTEQGNVEERVNRYIDELQSKYQIANLFLLYDNSYHKSLPMMNPKDLSSRHNVFVTQLIPALPHLRSSQSHIYKSQDRTIEITSKEMILFGINDCLNQYINEYETLPQETITAPQKKKI